MVIHKPTSILASRRSYSAFTLIESLVALAMLAVILPIVMQGISLAISLSSQARHQTEAANLARMKLDELVVTQEWNGGSALQGNFGEQWPGYEWAATINTWQDGSMSELDVKVTWTARQRQRAITMTTLVSPDVSQ